MTPRVLVFLALLTGVSRLASADLASDLRARVHDFRLSNGMQFLVVENHHLPIVSGLIYVNAGAAQDQPKASGLAHFLEHLMFKGTVGIGTTDYDAERPALDKVERAYAALAQARQARTDSRVIARLEQEFAQAQELAGRFVITNEYSQAIESAGGHNLNARTTADATTFFYALPSNQLELWFYLESERLLHPVFREFFQERKVVQEELRKRVGNDAVGTIMEEACGRAFAGQPYREPVLGRPDDLENLSPGDVRRFYETHYRPDNVIAVLFGDVDPDTARMLAEKYFLRWSPQPAASPTGNQELEPPASAKNWTTSSSLVGLAFRRPPLRNPDSLLYEAAMAWLCQDQSALLYRKLVRSRRLVAELGSYTAVPGQRYAGLCFLYMKPAQGHSRQEVLQACREELARADREGLSFFDLAEVKRKLRQRFQRNLQEDRSLMLQLATHQALAGDWREFFRLPEKIHRITLVDVRRIVRTFLQPEQSLVCGPAGGSRM